MKKNHAKIVIFILALVFLFGGCVKKSPINIDKNVIPYKGTGSTSIKQPDKGSLSSQLAKQSNIKKI